MSSVTLLLTLPSRPYFHPLAGKLKQGGEVPARSHTACWGRSHQDSTLCWLFLDRETCHLVPQSLVFRGLTQLVRFSLGRAFRDAARNPVLCFKCFVWRNRTDLQGFSDKCLTLSITAASDRRALLAPSPLEATNNLTGRPTFNIDLAVASGSTLERLTHPHLPRYLSLHLPRARMMPHPRSPPKPHSREKEGGHGLATGGRRVPVPNTGHAQFAGGRRACPETSLFFPNVCELLEAQPQPPADGGNASPSWPGPQGSRPQRGVAGPRKGSSFGGANVWVKNPEPHAT